MGNFDHFLWQRKSNIGIGTGNILKCMEKNLKKKLFKGEALRKVLQGAWLKKRKSLKMKDLEKQNLWGVS